MGERAGGLAVGCECGVDPELVVCPRCDRRLLFCPPEGPAERGYAGPIATAERLPRRGPTPAGRRSWPSRALDELEGDTD
jgi:hypothetical protein